MPTAPKYPPSTDGYHIIPTRPHTIQLTQASHPPTEPIPTTPPEGRKITYRDREQLATLEYGTYPVPTFAPPNHSTTPFTHNQNPLNPHPFTLDNHVMVDASPVLPLEQYRHFTNIILAYGHPSCYFHTPIIRVPYKHHFYFSPQLSGRIFRTINDPLYHDQTPPDNPYDRTPHTLVHPHNEIAHTTPYPPPDTLEIEQLRTHSLGIMDAPTTHHTALHFSPPTPQHLKPFAHLSHAIVSPSVALLNRHYLSTPSTPLTAQTLDEYLEDNPTPFPLGLITMLHPTNPLTPDTLTTLAGMLHPLGKLIVHSTPAQQTIDYLAENNFHGQRITPQHYCFSAVRFSHPHTR